MKNRIGGEGAVIRRRIHRREIPRLRDAALRRSERGRKGRARSARNDSFVVVGVSVAKIMDEI